MTLTASGDVLTRLEADERGALVGDVRYELALELDAKSDTYLGNAKIEFVVRAHGDLFLDWVGDEVLGFEIDGRPAEPARTDGRIRLPGLEPGPHAVAMRYRSRYDRTGDGFHRFVDPEDGATYLYTNFAPFLAHRLFPCFDQPDLKATYRLTVDAPAGWVVVSNGPEADATALTGGVTRHRFAPVGPFSTYLFAVAAGPYHVVTDPDAPIPLRLLCRRTLSRYLASDEAREVFELTRQGLAYFGKLFGRPYMFGKYDQLFVPEFNIGGMENVAAVTLGEAYLFRDPPTARQRLYRADLVLHELSHMWFGDFVTMRWWDDLWLNESFASYVASLAVDEASRFPNAWLEFNRSKRTALIDDQRPTTHPVSGDVPDTDATYLNFDGITYGKGSAIIRQLVATIGRDAFEDGLRIYFGRHAYGNTTLHDFLAAIEEASGRGLAAWTHVWLETASVDTLTASWSAAGDRLHELRLNQEAPADHPILRPHRVDIGLGYLDGDRVRIDRLPATIDGREAAVEIGGDRPRPTLVFPDASDLTYAKVRLDPESTAAVRRHIDRIGDPLLRQLLWSSLWEMVRDQQLSSLDYLALIRAKLPLDPTIEIHDNVLRGFAALGWPYVPAERRASEGNALASSSWDVLGAQTDGDIRVIWARALIDAVATPEDVGWATRLIDDGDAIAGFTPDQEMRWALAVKSVAHELPGAERRLVAERQRDPSDRGERELARAEAARPTAESKAAVWQRIHDDGYPSLHLARAAMSGFNWLHQRDLLEDYVEGFFGEVGRIAATRDRAFLVYYVHELFPLYRPEPAVILRSERALSEVADRSPILERLLRDAHDELVRAQECQRFARASGGPID